MIEPALIVLFLLAVAIASVCWDLSYPQVSLTRRDFVWLGWKPTHVHKKGGLYEEATRAICTDDVEAGETVVLYVAEDGCTYVRAARMFDEAGRFIELPE